MVFHVFGGLCVYYTVVWSDGGAVEGYEGDVLHFYFLTARQYFTFHPNDIF